MPIASTADISMHARLSMEQRFRKIVCCNLRATLLTLYGKFVQHGGV